MLNSSKVKASFWHSSPFFLCFSSDTTVEEEIRFCQVLQHRKRSSRINGPLKPLDSTPFRPHKTLQPLPLRPFTFPTKQTSRNLPQTERDTVLLGTRQPWKDADVSKTVSTGWSFWQERAQHDSPASVARLVVIEDEVAGWVYWHVFKWSGNFYRLV